MQRIVKDFRRTVEILRGDSSQGDESRGADGNGSVANSGRQTMEALNDDDEMMKQQILSQLEVVSYEGGCGTPEEREVTPIDHIRQTENWDCGLACVQMILQWLRHDDISRSRRDFHVISADDDEVHPLSRIENKKKDKEKAWMIDFVQTSSIWTIDLVFLLEHILSTGRITSENKNNIAVIPDICDKEDNEVERQHHCPVKKLGQFSFPPLSSWSYLFCSTKFVVDESYNNLGYYKDKFTSDEKRVETLFDIARNQKLPLLQTTHLSLGALVDIVSRKDVVAIVLLDNRILMDNGKSSYCGHYVILCGVSYDENDIQYAHMNSPEENISSRRDDFVMVMKNPGIWKQTEFVTPSIFEKARRATGTDEDILFLSKHNL